VTDRPTPVGNELDLRALRYFVAAAEELHFTRAAARNFVAQQALSRDIARLERQLGTPLFVRTTRRVALTPAGERLLGRARELLALHDLTWAELHPSTPTLVIDLLSEGRRTGPRVLEAVRAALPETEVRGRYGGGMGRTVGRLLAGDIDLGLGRVSWSDGATPRGIETHLLRYEALGLLLPDDHPLAALEAIPVAALDGLEIDVNIDDPDSPEWSDLARQLLALAGATSAPKHTVAIGSEETSHHLRRQGLPILVGVDQAPVEGGVIRPLVDPVPVQPWSIALRRGGAAEPGIGTAIDAALAVAAADGWLDMPADAWLPLPERARSPVTSPSGS
jgi:DNA-binding transcriptional LysR family regulator